MISILGISAFYHDSAACVLKDGKIIAAAQEERFTRKKHDPSYPKNAINFVKQIIIIRCMETLFSELNFIWNIRNLNG